MSELDAHGRTPEEQAYVCWIGEGEQSDVRTAEITGIPRSTIGYWRRRDDWRARWLSGAEPEADLAARSARTLAKGSMAVVTKRLLAIVGDRVPVRDLAGQPVRGEDGQVRYQWESEHRDAVNAAKLLALYGWGQPTAQDTAGLGALPAQFWPAAPQPAGAPNESSDQEPTIDALRQQASAMIEATVAGVNTRTRVRGRRV